MNPKPHTADRIYTERLLRKQGVWWKQALDVQAPYRWNLRRLQPGRTLEIGCGVGRNLRHLAGLGIGVDHNENSVKVARAAGFTALLSTEFTDSSYDMAEAYDSLLIAHVVEHMTLNEATNLIARYIRNLKKGGQVIIIAPQEAGFRTDHTHVEFMEFAKLRQIHSRLGLAIEKEYSFPFPRLAGVIFIYNEFVSVSRKSVDFERSGIAPIKPALGGR